jgi:hypothetical protein
MNAPIMVKYNDFQRRKGALLHPAIGYGVSLSGGELRTGPVLALGWSF